MGGQVLGGGVIVLVAVALWLVYLLPSWHSRYRFDAAERNAVRLGQALRVLAETSDTPDEVRLELSTRTALAQQKIARQVQHEREQVQLEDDRRRLAEARREARVARESSTVRAAQIRRRARLTASIVAVAAAAAAVWGGVLVSAGGSAIVLSASLATVALCAIVLGRMAAVARRAQTRPAMIVRARAAVSQPVQDVEFEAPAPATWTPRPLPRPLTASVGSRAAAVLDEVDAQQAVRRAAVAEAIRVEAERRAPARIESARPVRPAAGAGPDFARMGFVDDAEIEDHVRRLLESRAAG